MKTLILAAVLISPAVLADDWPASRESIKAYRDSLREGFTYDVRAPIPVPQQPRRYEVESTERRGDTTEMEVYDRDTGQYETFELEWR